MICYFVLLQQAQKHGHFCVNTDRMTSFGQTYTYMCGCCRKYGGSFPKLWPAGAACYDHHDGVVGTIAG